MKKYIAGKQITVNNNTVGKYKCFVPSFLNRQYVINDSKILVLVEQVAEVLGKLNAYSTLIPDIDFFIKMHVNHEAVASNIIEGTHTEMEELFLEKEEVSPERRDDREEVVNYVESMNYAVARLENNFPLTVRLLNDTHQVLLANVRGESKQPGEVRTMQNWLGSRYLSDATFIPPAPLYLDDLLSDLELFWHNKSIALPKIIRTAMTHYQFETIHPYNDGNGRLGRLLITLQLIDQELLSKPVLYISDYFEKNKNKYFEAFEKVRSENDMEGWIRFFLTALVDAGNKSVLTLGNIVKLRADYEKRILSLGQRSQNAQELLVYLYAKPVVSNTEVSKVLDVSYNSAKALTQALEDLDILEEFTHYSRNKKYVLREYLELFK
jgi:Fic family protein